MKNYVSRLKKEYESKIAPSLQKDLGLDNMFSVPKLEKIVITMSLKDSMTDSKVIEKTVEELFAITGQKPVITKAKKAIAAFKLKEGVPIGVKVTLRKNMMYDFFDRFLNIALPRMKDFRGLSTKKFDGRGNYAIGLKEHTIFPEINYDKVDKVKGMNIVIVTSANKDQHALELLRAFNFPFMK